MMEEYDSCLAASKRIQTEQERDRRAEARRIRSDLEVVAEVRQLQQERKQYESTKEWNHKSDRSNQSSKEIREHEAALHRATRRREHYHSWLSSQIVLNSICANDIRETGESGIPDRKKRPIYPGYPGSEPSDHMGKNATPGPSRPRVQPERQDWNNDIRSNRRSQNGDAPQRNSRRTAVGNPPSDPNDSSSSDTTYRPQRSESRTTTTESSLTPTTVEDDRREHHARRSHGRKSNHGDRNYNRHHCKCRHNARNHNSDPSEPSDLTNDYSQRTDRPSYNRQPRS